jgi:hypothetical protein
MQELVAFFSDAFAWRLVKEACKRAIRPKNLVVIVLDEDHVRDEIKNNLPFLHRASHFFFGLFLIGDVLNDEDDAWFPIIEGRRNMLDSQMDCLVLLVILFFYV